MELNVEDEGKGGDELQSNSLKLRYIEFEILWLVIENYIF